MPVSVSASVPAASVSVPASVSEKSYRNFRCGDGWRAPSTSTSAVAALPVLSVCARFAFAFRSLPEVEAGERLLLLLPLLLFGDRAGEEEGDFDGFADVADVAVGELRMGELRIGMCVSVNGSTASAARDGDFGTNDSDRDATSVLPAPLPFPVSLRFPFPPFAVGGGVVTMVSLTGAPSA